jgi:hypothetical protein
MSEGRKATAAVVSAEAAQELAEEWSRAAARASVEYATDEVLSNNLHYAGLRGKSYVVVSDRFIFGDDSGYGLG